MEETLVDIYRNIFINKVLGNGFDMAMFAKWNPENFEIVLKDIVDNSDDKKAVELAATLLKIPNSEMSTGHKVKGHEGDE